MAKENGIVWMMDAAPKRQPRRILIVRLSSLGDIVHALPVSHALRSYYPGASIVWLTQERYKSLLEMNSCINELLVLKERRAWNVVGHLWDLLQMICRIRQGRYDVVLDLHAIVTSHLLVWLSGAPVKLGVDKRNDLGFRMFTRHPLPKDEKPHRFRVYLDTLRFLGIECSGAAFPIVIPLSARERIEKFLREHDITPKQLLVAIHPGTAVGIKRWSAERFAELAARLAVQTGTKVILIHGDGDRSIPVQSGQGIIQAPPLSLQELAELLRRSDLVIGNDSGPLQLAAALGRPTAMIFGPSDPRVTGPYGTQHLVIREELPCSPCYENFKIYFHCKTRTRACLKRIIPKRVLREIVPWLTDLRRHRNPDAATEVK